MQIGTAFQVFPFGAGQQVRGPEPEGVRHYWANQGLLQAVRALEEVEVDQPSELPPLAVSAMLSDRLRRTQAMIEETRVLMNRNLVEWIEQEE